MKEPLLYKIVRPIIKVFVRIAFRPKYIGLNNIPTSGRIILSGNHTNNLDCILLISSTKRVIHFLAKDSLIKGIKKIIFNNIGIIPVNRKIHDKGALKKAIETLTEDKTIGIFPEGTINRTEDLVLPFKIGSVKMAAETNTRIIPFIITGKYKIFKNDLTIEFLSPFEVDKEDLTKSNEMLMNTISNKLKEKRK